ncbi:MAG: PorT family protein [Flavobacteriales bacterium]|jgi:hypothetical protein|nr:PorT family protein [Flavobacteriales bacterium]MBT5090240.1 PorT family protein [Flavobacteriales bacterium]MBT5750579.1 PorT family protein [Flavobacteriales bacterium]
MKKKFAILLFCGFFALSIQAQNFGGGIILGLSTSQVSGDNLGGFNKAGILAGGFIDLQLSTTLKGQMEMTFIQKGSNNANMNKNSISDISLSYVEIPLLLKYQQSSTIAIEGGIETAFLISSSDNDIYGQISANSTRKFNTTDISIFIGLDYFINPRLILNSRISNSILPIRAHASGATFQLNKGQYNSVLSFALHYHL